VKQGDFFALLGANGAGKSTTIGVIATFLTKTSGTVKVNGYDLDQQTELAKLSLGLIPQEMNLGIFETCERILYYQAGYYGLSRRAVRPKIQYLLKEVGLWEKRDVAVRHLSGGMKRRLMLARALVHDPSVLILDEPTAGVDVEIRHSLWRLLRQLNEKGTTIILTTHYLEEAEQLCKHIGIIHNGQIIQNTSMKNLLATLHQQTFIFSSKEPLQHTDQLQALGGILLDDYSFEWRIQQNQTLNHCFQQLTQLGIDINTMRNKTNRLEELFMGLIQS